MAGVSLINKEEQLSAMPLEDKDNQGGTWVCISNEPQLINQGSTKNQERLMEEEHVVVRILISRIGRCKEKLKARRGPTQWA
jgi:hypothetical protein